MNIIHMLISHLNVLFGIFIFMLFLYETLMILITICMASLITKNINML